MGNFAGRICGKRTTHAEPPSETRPFGERRGAPYLSNELPDDLRDPNEPQKDPPTSTSFNKTQSLSDSALRASSMQDASKPTLAELLDKIDRSEKDGLCTSAEELFNKLDTDKSGELGKEEFKELLEELAIHIVRKYDEHWGDTDMSYSKEEIKNNLKWDLDIDFDGKLSKDEFMRNVKRAVDQVD